jgi:hypothetical protein
VKFYLDALWEMMLNKLDNKNQTNFETKDTKSFSKYKTTIFTRCLFFLIDNICVQCGGHVLQHLICIKIGIAPYSPTCQFPHFYKVDLIDLDIDTTPPVPMQGSQIFEITER